MFLGFERPTFFGVPSYDFLMQVLYKVGCLRVQPGVWGFGIGVKGLGLCG